MSAASEAFADRADVDFAADRIRRAFGLGAESDTYGPVYRVLGYAWMCGASSPKAKEAGDLLAELMRRAGMEGEVEMARGWAESRRAMLTRLASLPHALEVPGDATGMMVAAEHVGRIVGEIASKKGGSK